MKLNIDCAQAFEEQAPLVLDGSIELQFFNHLDEFFPNREPHQKALCLGEVERFADTSKRKDNKNIWAVLFPSGYGAFGNWSTGQTIEHRPKYNRELTPLERIEEVKKFEQAKAETEAKLQADYEEKALISQKKWNDCQEATDEHPYLKNKGVKNHGLKLDKENKLIIPLSSEGKLWSYQEIDADGNKRIKGKKSGCYFIVGEGEPCYMAEGYATSSSIYEATGKACVMGVDAGNLPKVAKYFPKAVVVADNDESNTGLKYAERTGNKYKLIPIKGMDANDYAQAFGLEKLKNFLEQTTSFKEGFKTMDEIMSEPYEEDQYLIDNRVCKGFSVDYLGAPTGCGKTFLVTDWALSIAYGLENWNGSRIVQGKVVYFCGEAWTKYKKRLEAWKRYHGKDENTPNFIVYCGSKRKFTDKQMLGYIQEEMATRNYKPDLIIIDHQQKYTMGDENDGVTAKEIMARFYELAELYNCCVLVVHHFGKDISKGLKGNSIYSDDAMIIHSIKKDPKTGIYTLHQDKPKDEETQSDVFYQLKQVPLYVDGHGKQITSCVPYVLKKQAIADENGKEDAKQQKQREEDLELLKEFLLKDQGINLEGNVLSFTRQSLIDFLVNVWELDKKKAKDFTNPHTNNLVTRLVKGGVLQEPEALPKKDPKELQGFAWVVNDWYGAQIVEMLEQQRSKQQLELMSL